MSRRKVIQPLDLTHVDQRFIDRFWSKVDRRSPDECWEWTANRTADGYGRFVVTTGVLMTASRVALTLTVGPLEQGIVACHSCDNPPCCNPAHLFAGTQSDNAIDSVRKGRANRARGERAASSKLTEDDVRNILAEPARFGLNRDLSRQYGVSDNTIRKIRLREKWAHVDAEVAS